MSEIRFYHLQTQRVEQALPALLAKALSTGKRIIVKGTDEARLKQISKMLWIYDPHSFLPHGTQQDGFSEHQPIYLTAENDNPNGAEVLITIDGAALAEANDQFTLQCMIFDGHDQERLDYARTQWKALQDSDQTLTYWQQSPTGWEKKG